ncbi:MANSC domain-containing protein 1 [Phyllopteryx taeniolatus]|uniref:MANSC domain-containing protein 1 n=1 Tax=Phyllopteryx taeniolatus TaxID=161469 RepID=UPI002AD49FA5|nr:MANSC domain-containing protein 1 [Phyllopteryx taeniolatus]XP_061618712.1 MANSC domain-containing protein 1 [Phyllopteryx taeniolatus]
MTRALPLPRLLLLLLLPALLPARSEPDRCFSRQHPNAVVNARAALAGAGAGAGVAVSARALASERDCVLACCSQPGRPGAQCDVAVFDGNKRGGEDNCFLYRCPGRRDCPLAEAPPGVSTYDIFKGANHPSPLRPVGTTTVAMTTGVGAAPVPGTAATDAAAAGTSEKTGKKLDKTKTTRKTKSHPANEEAGSRTADKRPTSAPPATPPPTTTAPVTVTMTPPPTTITLPPMTVTPPATIATPPTIKSTPPPPTVTPPTTQTPLAPATTTPPTTTQTPPPPSTTSTTTAVTPPTTPVAPPPTTATPPPATLTTPTPLTSSSRRSQMSDVLVGPHGDAVQNGSVKTASGAGPSKSGAAVFLAVGVAVLLLALAVGGRKAMESFDRRHYTRLELNDLHYDL